MKKSVHAAALLALALAFSPLAMACEGKSCCKGGDKAKMAEKCDHKEAAKCDHKDAAKCEKHATADKKTTDDGKAKTAEKPAPKPAA